MKKPWWRRPIEEVIAETKLYMLVKGLLSRIVLPGFQGLPLWYVLTFFVKGLKHGSLDMRAASLAYNFFLALFPGILFFFTLIPYLPIDNLDAEVLILMQGIMPPDIYKASSSAIADIVNIKRSGLLALVLIVALYYSTNGVQAMMTAFNRTYHVSETRTWWRQRWVSIMLTLLFFLMMIFTATVFIIGSIVIKYLAEKGFIQKDLLYYGFAVVKYAFTIFITYVTFATLYYYGPTKKTRWKFFSVGSTLATVLFIATSYGLTVYLQYFNSYNKIYGSIGTIILLLFWIYINAWVLLLGFELNASIRSAKHTHKPEDI